MTDVAKLAGVSHQTVSRVLNGHPSVRPTTRVRVLAAIDQLGYRPNLAARALVTGRSRTLGLVTLDTTLFGPVATLYGIERAARETGYFVSVVSLRSIDRLPVQEAIARLAEQSVEGVIVIAPLTSAKAALADLPTDLPVVVVEGDPETDLGVVTVDQRGGARAATEHLLSLGHRTVFHVAGPTEWLEARERVAGWRLALEDAGAEVPSPLAGDWTARSGFDAGATLARIPEATAVFAANDHMALGLLRALRERGRRVPEDVSVVGFDDIAESEFFTPPLTTVRQDFDEVGRRCLGFLLERLDSGSRSVERVVIPPELVVRQSTAAPAPR
ncbi:MAG TPA: LacI family DNA-binding transcriptional regulator [Acidimicrobiales bacterium]|nr:LacI family DNA-binding transcriptional regulator [Acidimicrobiales bacterium]